MAENSKIAWTTHTFSPWLGCEKISAGCDRCYAESWAKRYGRGELWQGERQRTTENNWRKVHSWNRVAAREGRRDKVFVASLADVFDNQADPKWRDDLWALIRLCGALDFLVLTKRPQNIEKMLPASWGAGWPNVWLGASVCIQVEADRLVPILADVPARIRFLSCEPLLEPISFSATTELERAFRLMSWVIAGGESGHGARPMALGWLKGIQEDCLDADTPLFVKQLGGSPDKRDDPMAWPAEFRVQEFPR